MRSVERKIRTHCAAFGGNNSKKSGMVGCILAFFSRIIDNYSLSRWNVYKVRSYVNEA